MRMSLKPFFCRIKTKSEYRASVKKLSELVDRGDSHDGLGIPYEDLMTPPERPRYRKVAML